MKRKMLQFSAELSNKLELIIVTSGYPVLKRKMFGHETFFLNGYMFAGANEKGVFVHIGIEEKEKALKTEKGVTPFEPMEGMVMKDYLLLQETIYSAPDQLKKWLEQSSRYLLALPPKKKKAGSGTGR